GRSEPARAQASGDLAAIADLGSRAGDGATQTLHDGDGCSGVLLRSAEPLAARLKRKHQRPVTAIPAEEHRPVRLLAVGSGQDRSAAQSAPATNIGFSNSCG